MIDQSPSVSPSSRGQVLLLALTLLLLLPFSGKPFHVDDMLFISAAKQIVQHPLNPYGFHISWYAVEMPMAEVTKNPPLSSYYGALVGVVFGWSERAWHFAFVVPVLAAILGIRRLATHFTKNALLAAVLTLLTPVFLLSATGVMCDAMMLAFWVWAAVLWIESLDPEKPSQLAASALLIAAAALTKYFGASLIVLIFAYSLLRKRRVGLWALYLLIPIVCLVAYHFWTYALYGRGLLADAAVYARFKPENQRLPLFAQSVIGLSFLGGCVLPALVLSPLLWSRKLRLAGAALSGLAVFPVAAHWVPLTTHVPSQNWAWMNVELALFIAGGISLVALALRDLWEQKDANSAFLVLWVLGTFFFAGFLNWSANGRSILPLVPAAAILIARRFERVQRPAAWKLALPLLAAGVVSLWIACGDTAWARSARDAASMIRKETQNRTVWFAGHWGFQYYLQALGGRPVDIRTFSSNYQSGDFIAIPKNNTNTFDLAPEVVASRQIIELPINRRTATMCPELGAGFYSSVWGPLPFAFGPVTPERYQLLELTKPAATEAH